MNTRLDGSQISGSDFLFPDEYTKIEHLEPHEKAQYQLALSQHPNPYWLKYSYLLYTNGTYPIYTEWVLYEREPAHFAQQLCQLCHVDLSTLCTLLLETSHTLVGFIEQQLLHLHHVALHQLWYIHYQIYYQTLRTFAFPCLEGFLPYWNFTHGAGPYPNETVEETHSLLQSESAYEEFFYDGEDDPRTRMINAFGTYIRMYLQDLYSRKMIYDAENRVEYIQQFAQEDILLPFLNDMRSKGFDFDESFVQDLIRYYYISIRDLISCVLTDFLEELETLWKQKNLAPSECFRLLMLFGQMIRYTKLNLYPY